MAPSGMSALYRVVYRSTAVGILTGAELDRVLLRAKAANAGAGMTGLMLFCDGAFLQVIEGPPAGVLSLMEKIRRDRRHSGLTVLESELTTTRMFPGWAMGYVATRNLTSEQKTGLTDILATPPQSSRVSPVQVLPMVERLWPFLGAFREAEAA